VAYITLSVEQKRSKSHKQLGKASHGLFKGSSMPQVERSGIIRESTVNQVDFAHRTFQEFFAAKAAIDEGDSGGCHNECCVTAKSRKARKLGLD